MKLYKRPNGKKQLELKQQVNMSKCKYCHTTENLTLDHKLPLSRGGSNEKKNLQCLCFDCNSMKGNMTNADVRRMWNWHTRVILEKHENQKAARRAKKKPTEVQTDTLASL